MPKPATRSASVFLLLLVLILTACGGEAPPAASTGTPDSAAPDAPSSPAPAATDDATAGESGEALAATVNGEPIPLAAYQSELRREEARYQEIGLVPADRAAFERSVLNKMIDQALIEQAARIQGLAVTNEELEAEIALQVELAGGEGAWQDFLAANLYTEDEYRASIRSALLSNKIRDQVIATVPEAVEQVHARHILVGTRAEADALLAQLNDGADFGELAFAHSRDVSTREIGGDLGWFAEGQLTERVVEEAAFALEAGEISAPVQSRLGTHIIQTLERVENRPLDETARADLFEITFERWRQSLLAQAQVEILVE